MVSAAEAMEMIVGKGQGRSPSVRSACCPWVVAAARAPLLASILHTLAMCFTAFDRLLNLRGARQAAELPRHQFDHNAATNPTKQSNNLLGSRCSLGRSRMAGVPAPPKAGRIDDLPAGERGGSITRYGQVPLRDAATAQLDADGARARGRRGEHPAALHARRRERHEF